MPTHCPQTHKTTHTCPGNTSNHPSNPPPEARPPRCPIQTSPPTHSSSHLISSHHHWFHTKHYIEAASDHRNSPANNMRKKLDVVLWSET
ncbi:hypothetical protein M758_4G012500 [Ceratodon purpureus]|uniref:Uncharacterized protein n=1 Tax=Ceratodon purpureus TaxID=3225 RepID=A0A8T0I5E1_CERPU|nr:hypothetical protein KC19_4G013700 [Ceratodon purpureus]KAG0617753.1 hypothetical protein M758_4G012500 [Ceratodon purpureus]